MPTAKKSVHKNATRSRHLIKKAFGELLNEKDINKITVTDIVERANISRGTFYAHYLDVYDLHAAIQHNILEAVDALFDELGVLNIVADPTEAITRGVTFLDLNKSYYKLFAMTSHSNVLLDRIKNIIEEKIMTEVDNAFTDEAAMVVRSHVLYAMGGIESVIMHWFSGELDMQGEKLSVLLSSICLSQRPPELLIFAKK